MKRMRDLRPSESRQTSELDNQLYDLRQIRHSAWV